MSVYALFALTVLPLIFTPGPDMLFILSQVMGKGARAGIMATLGICAGYILHSVFVAFGIAAMIVSFPVLFEAIRGLGIAYLLYLAFGLFKSAWSNQPIHLQQHSENHPIRKGFLTAFLNPKGMLIYFAILPQFIDQSKNTVSQGMVLSLIFIALIFVIYCGLSFIFAQMTKKSDMDGRRQKWIDGVAGGLLSVAATWLMVH